MASGEGSHGPPPSRPYSVSKDEAFARQLQEEEETARLQEDEEMARRMQRDMNTIPHPAIRMHRGEGRPPLRTMTPITQLFTSLLQHGTHPLNTDSLTDDHHSSSESSDVTVEENVPPRSTQGPSTVRGTRRGRGITPRRASHGLRPTETEVVTPSPSTSSAPRRGVGATTRSRARGKRGSSIRGKTKRPNQVSTQDSDNSDSDSDQVETNVPAPTSRGRGKRGGAVRGRGRGQPQGISRVVEHSDSESDEEETSGTPHPPRSMEASVPPVSLALNRPTLPRGETEPEILLVDRDTSNNDARFIHIMRDPMLLILFLMGRRPDLLVPDDVDPNDYESLWELAERIGEVKNRGLEEKEMKKLPTRKFTSKAKVFTEDHEGPQCRVCLSAYKTGDNLCTLPCKHEFHAACVKEWLKRNANCPICRYELKK